MSKTSSYGPLLKNIREDVKLTQGNVAKYLQVDQSIISRFESGEKNLSLGQIEKFATLLGVDVSSLASNNVEARTFSSAIKPDDLSAQDIEAIAAINRISLNSNLMTKILTRGKAR